MLEDWGSNLGLVKSDAVLPLRRYFEAVLSRRRVAEVDPPLVTRFGVIPQVRTSNLNSIVFAELELELEVEKNNQVRVH